MIAMASSKDVLDVARSWLGRNEADKSHQIILDIYNQNRPSGLVYAYPDTPWCDIFVSACAIKANAVDLIGISALVEGHIGIFKKKGIWEEDGTITPEPGDLIVYSSNKKTQPNDAYSTHIGFVENVVSDTIVTIEGNVSDRVARRAVLLGDGAIRGFGRPKYSDTDRPKPNKSLDVIAREVIRGIWGSDPYRSQSLRNSGYSPEEVQRRVNELLGKPKEHLTPVKSIDTVAREVIAGRWGCDPKRSKALCEAGYDPRKVQERVNELLGYRDDSSNK